MQNKVCHAIFTHKVSMSLQCRVIAYEADKIHYISMSFTAYLNKHLLIFLCHHATLTTFHSPYLLLFLDVQCSSMPH
jgi:hypothetical protein